MRGHTGDRLQITGHRVGEKPRVGEIIEVLGEPDHVHYRVRWDTGEEGIVYPASDTVIEPRGSGG